ncbi:DUF6350 family protein [uncultured Demequina sp.]|uniref:cell division protein PerM n=1 Tax=uncultured Demequina sp. TaxID=693499 RepID=UPI0025D370EF|nr:DUF6350 family protein [uncultured Demequina sp.]
MSTRSLASDLRALGRRGIDAIKAAPAWLGGILTGFQGALLGYLLVLAPSMAVAAASPTTSLSAGVDWSGAAMAAGRLWLFGLGGPAELGGTVVSLVPLGLTLVYGAILAAIARRFAARTWGSWSLAVATYAALVSVAASAILGPEASDAIVRVTVVAALLAAVFVAAGVWRAHGLELGWLARIPEVVRVGLRRAAAVTAFSLCAAALAQTAWAVVNRDRIGTTATALDLDGIGAVVLAIGELAYAPTMVVWQLAWLTGQGFSVGLGSAYAPDAMTASAIPGLPILGALPSAAGGLLVWAPAVLVVVATLARAVVRRASLGWRRDAAADVLAVTIVAAAAGALTLAAAGAAGPGRLETVGADALPVAIASGGLAAAGLALGTLIVAFARWVASVLPWGRRPSTPSSARATAPRTPSSPEPPRTGTVTVKSGAASATAPR